MYVRLSLERWSANNSSMSQTKRFRIGEYVCCECPEDVSKLPFGLPRNAALEVVGTLIDTTHVLYSGKLFAVPTACVQSHQFAGSAA
jgi:hypothetical protein